MQRLLLALSAAALTVIGLALFFYDDVSYAATASVCLRAGLVLGAIALALPQVKRFLERVPPWFLACILVGFLFIIRWPRSAAVVLPVLVALWFLGPRSKPPVRTPKKRPAKAGARRG